MQELIRQVLDLQHVYDKDQTDAMRLRGGIINKEMPVWIRTANEQIFTDFSWLKVDAGDGAGSRSQIPWVRLFDSELSPKATAGWQVVYLFSGDGRRCYLCVMHGSTVWRDGDFKARTADEIAPLVEWGKRVIGPTRSEREIDAIELNALGTSAARHYPKSTISAFEYLRSDVPDNDQLTRDLDHMTRQLALIYEQVDRDPFMPDADPAEIALTIETIETVQGRTGERGRGQGFRLSKAEQLAVERRAVDLASQYWEERGWRVRDVGATSSYDLHCTRQGESLLVEVKGTTSAGDRILLTRNEVQLHLREYPRNALAVVSGITLKRTGAEPEATGGDLHMHSPWLLDPDRLSPLAYEYSLA